MDHAAALISLRARGLGVFCIFFGIFALLMLGCDDPAQAGGEAWHHARDFVKVEPGTRIHRSCGRDNEKDDSFEVGNTRCKFTDNIVRSDGQVVNAVIIQLIESQGGFSSVYIGEEPGIQSASVYGRGYTAVRMPSAACRGDSFASTPPCSVELVHLERSDEARKVGSHYDENSSVTLRVSCPEELMGHFGDHMEAMRQTPTHFEFHATRCAVIHYPYPRNESPGEEE